MKKFIVISHTHWDREWYMPFEQFRLRLVDLIDRLLEIIEGDENYIFHLDAQTVVLEDYLVIRPENEEKLRAFIKAGNIIVGPWYLQSDFYLTDGESTIRNLQRGMAIAEKFGACSRAGYAPDQFGNVSQLPQILREFGIDTFVFGRGYRVIRQAPEGWYTEADTPAEFIWQGADGSRCLAVCMKKWYNNAQHIPAETEYAKMLLDMNAEYFEKFNVTPYILLMNGVDHLEAQDDLLPILHSLQAEGIDIRQTTLDKYLTELKDYIAENKCHLSLYTGALNLSDDYSLLKGCWSSRIYLKQSNVALQDMLEYKLEPLYTYLLQKGGIPKYPRGEMDYMWKLLLQNQPHDSICGCSRDEVHSHMEDSYARLGECADDMLRRGMSKLTAHGYSPLRRDENYCVTVFNPTEAAYTGVITAALDFLAEENVTSFRLYNDRGEEVPYAILSRVRTRRGVFSPLNLPGVVDVDRTVIEFEAENVPPFTSACFAAVPGETAEILVAAPRGDAIENEFYRVYVKENTLWAEDKRTNKVYPGAIAFEESADRGDAYVYRPDGVPAVFDKCRYVASENTALTGSLTAEFVLDCPRHYDFENLKRAGERAEIPVRVTVSLSKGSDVLELSYRFFNTCEDHRIRLRCNFGQPRRVFTDSPFDFAERFSHESCIKTDSDTHHASSFVLSDCGDHSFALLHTGQYEQEKTERGIATTVLRATGWINRDGMTFRQNNDDQWVCPDNQCKREIAGRVGLVLGEKFTPAQLFAKVKQFRTGLLVQGDSFDVKKYAGGRFALQTAELNRFYYVKDPCENAVTAGPLFMLQGDAVAVSCVKQGVRGGMVLRLVNLEDGQKCVTVTADGDIYRTNMAETEEAFLGSGSAAVEFGPKQVITLLVK